MNALDSIVDAAINEASNVSKLMNLDSGEKPSPAVNVNKQNSEKFIEGERASSFASNDSSDIGWVLCYQNSTEDLVNAVAGDAENDLMVISYGDKLQFNELALDLSSVF